MEREARIGGATVASVCLRVWVKQSGGERDLKAQSEGFKSTECKKHLRVKSQNVENAENQKHTKRQNKVKLKKYGCPALNSATDYIFMIVICIMHRFSGCCLQNMNQPIVLFL